MGDPLKLLNFQRLLDSAHLSHRGGRSTGRLADTEDAKGPDLEPGWVGILQVRGRPDLPTESGLNDGLEGRFPTGSKGLGLHQKVIGKNQCRFHNMADSMVVRLLVKRRRFSKKEKKGQKRVRKGVSS